MALLEKLEPGNIYLVKICAANQYGEGPFSSLVDVALPRASGHRSKNPRHSDSFPETPGTEPGQTSTALQSCLVGLNDQSEYNCVKVPTENLNYSESKGSRISNRYRSQLFNQ